MVNGRRMDDGMGVTVQVKKRCGWNLDLFCRQEGFCVREEPRPTFAAPQITGRATGTFSEPWLSLGQGIRSHWAQAFRAILRETTCPSFSLDLSLPPKSLSQRSRALPPDYEVHAPPSFFFICMTAPREADPANRIGYRRVVRIFFLRMCSCRPRSNVAVTAQPERQPPSQPA